MDAHAPLCAALRDCLALAPEADIPVAERRAEHHHDDHTRTELWLNGIPASLLLPRGAGPFAAVLYCHAHGGDHALGRREMLAGARWLSAPPAPDLIAAGLAVLALDMPGFGERTGEGSESALAKAGLWRGRPLFGQMIADQMAGFRWLAAQPQIAADRIVTLGTSMGGALAMWTGALEPRVAAVAQMCMLADIAPLIAAGVHDRHGPYLTVPGLLRHAEMGDVAGLVAPRPQFVAHGDTDPLTPPEARDAALDRLRRAYGPSGALQLWRAAGSGHVETPEMRRAMLGFLTRHGAPRPAKERETC